mmetsp:Transcript_80929/g.179868  ORF Transcript_80929/g.179868 Transcript_80929/m.179868 type:complete len:314 (+) Transcript_80929:86-1027(+)
MCSSAVAQRLIGALVRREVEASAFGGAIGVRAVSSRASAWPPVAPLGASGSSAAAGLGALLATRHKGFRRLASSGQAAAPPGSRECWNSQPKSWEDPHEPPVGITNLYSAAEVNSWRAEFGFARRQHSLASFGYTDDELREWRKPFDEVAQGNRIPFPVFEKFVARKYSGVISDERLAQKVRHFWAKFDQDHNDFVDFGEFISAGLLIDVDWAKEKIRKQGIEDTFTSYAEDGFMFEPHFFQLMCDFRFFVATATDVRTLMRIADKDCDGLVSLSDFVQWAGSEDLGEDLEAEVPQRPRRRRRGGLAPPPEPE